MRDRLQRPVYALLRLGGILAVGTGVAACGGGSGGSDPTPVNAPLTVDAGAGQTVDELTEVALSGSARDNDGTIRSYRWTQIAGPNVQLVDADTAEASFIAPDGSGGSVALIFRLTATGDSGETASDEVTLTVNFRNSPPTVDAGADQTVAERTEIALSGSAQDEDGTIRSYRWTQVAGPSVDLVDADRAAARFTTPDGLSGSAELVFRLTVRDDSGVAASDDVIITVTFANNPPIVRSGVISRCVAGASALAPLFPLRIRTEPSRRTNGRRFPGPLPPFAGTPTGAYM